MMSGLQPERELKKEESLRMRIKERPFGIKAAQDLLAKSNVDPLEIDMIMATATPDMPVVLLQGFVATGATNAFAYDLQAACSSFCTECLLQPPTFNQEGIKVLLIGADKMSSIVDYTDRSTCIILQVLSI
jgi:3-oxoacyl-[acyl-carrier-protein] synthase-3